MPNQRCSGCIDTLDLLLSGMCRLWLSLSPRTDIYQTRLTSSPVQSPVYFGRVRNLDWEVFVQFQVLASKSWTARHSLQAGVRWNMGAASP